MAKRSHTGLYILATSLLICALGYSFYAAPYLKGGIATDTPTFHAVQVFDADGNQILPDETGWIVLSSKCIIAVKYKGIVSKADFYTVPTGTETISEKVLIGTLTPSGDSAFDISLEWRPPLDFMGYILVVLYNNQVSISSEDNFLIKAYLG